MSENIHVLIVEDLPSDADLSEREILKALGSCEFRRVETREAFLAALEEFRPALIVSDFKMPSFDGLTALELALEHCPDVPFIIVTGSMNEDTAVECMKAGAWDYVIKEHVKRLGPAVLSALARQHARMERMRAERALAASETRYRRLFEAAKDGVLILDADTGKIVDVNPFLMELTGYSLEHFLGKHLWEIGPFKDAAAAKASFAELQASNYIRYEDLPLRTSDGRTIEVEFVSNAYPVDGQSLVQCNIRDITERKREEIALRESEESFRAIFENNSAAMVIIERDTTISMVNREYCKMAGCEAEDVIGMSWTEQIPPADLERMKEYNRKRLIDPKSVPEKYAFTFYRKDREIRNCLMSVAVLPTSQKILSSFIDITELMRADKELLESKQLVDSIVENAPFMIFLKEAQDLRFVVFNRAGEELLGYDRKDLLGKNNLDLFPPEQAAHFMAKDREVLAAGALLDIPEEPIQTANKGTRVLHTRKLCIKGADGVTKYLLGISEDITERKLADETLRQSEERFRVLFEQAADSILLLEIRPESPPVIRDVNSATLRLLGYERDELIGQPISFIDGAVDASKVVGERQRHVRGRTPGAGAIFEAEHRCKDGALLEFECSVAEMRIGSKTLAISVERDITARKRAEEKSQGQMEELQRWQEVMLGREDRVQELKREVNEICRRGGEPVRYSSQEASPPGSESEKVSS